jgi:hypothetical protein
MRFVPHVPRSLRPGTAVVWGRPRGFRLALIIGGFLVCLAGAGLIAVRDSWPPLRLGPDPVALAQVTIAPVGERISEVRVLDQHGQPVRFAVAQHLISPTQKLRPGTRIRVDVTVRRAGWLGWLLGRTTQAETVIRIPAASVTATLVRPASGGPVRITFSRPVRIVTVESPQGERRRLVFTQPRRTVPVGIQAVGPTTSGTVLAAGAPRLWERPPSPVRVTWFPAGPEAQALVRPAPKTALVPSQPIVLTFSRTVAESLGSDLPKLIPQTPGAWRQPNSHMLVFQPDGTGFPLGTQVRVVLPAEVTVRGAADPPGRTVISWHVPPASPVRLRQLLAQLNYLPLWFKPTDGPVRETAAEAARSAVEPPAGTFVWRHPNTPGALKSLWNSSGQAVLMRGALMAFESTHGMPVDGLASRAVWQKLLQDEVAGKPSQAGYSYVYVSERLPQTLTLWQNGHVVLKTLVNTGISSRPTALGTFPVYAHLTSTTMSGTNPDGTHYSDPGVPWVNYFNGGDAVHGFVRGSYGWPQSLGCVEVEPSTAALIFPHVQIGTLVTVAAS